MKTRLRAVSGVLAIVLWTMLAAAPAQAHDEEADLVVTSAEPVDGTSVKYAVRLTFRNDGHGAGGATVTAVAEGAGGNVAPVALAPAAEEGNYEGTVTFPAPGSWQVRFTAVSPQATVVQAQEVTAATTTTAGASTTELPTTGDADQPELGNDNVGSSDDESGSAAGPIAFFAVLLGVIAVGVLAAISARRARRGRATAS